MTEADVRSSVRALYAACFLPEPTIVVFRDREDYGKLTRKLFLRNNFLGYLLKIPFYSIPFLIGAQAILPSLLGEKSAGIGDIIFGCFGATTMFVLVSLLLTLVSGDFLARPFDVGVLNGRMVAAASGDPDRLPARAFRKTPKGLLTALRSGASSASGHALPDMSREPERLRLGKGRILRRSISPDFEWLVSWLLEARSERFGPVGELPAVIQAALGVFESCEEAVLFEGVVLAVANSPATVAQSRPGFLLGLGEPTLRWSLPYLGKDGTDTERLFAAAKWMEGSFGVQVRTRLGVSEPPAKMTPPELASEPLPAPFGAMGGSASIWIRERKREWDKPDAILKAAALQPDEIRLPVWQAAGAGSVVRALSATPAASDGTGELYRLGGRPGTMPWCVVKVLDKVTGADGKPLEHWIGVPMHMASAREGVAWSFGMPERGYAPTVEA